MTFTNVYAEAVPIRFVHTHPIDWKTNVGAAHADLEQELQDFRNDGRNRWRLIG